MRQREQQCWRSPLRYFCQRFQSCNQYDCPAKRPMSLLARQVLFNEAMSDPKHLAAQTRERS